MTAAGELRADPLSFIRHYYIVLSHQLHKPAQKDVFRDGTVRIKLIETTGDYAQNSVTRPRNRKGLGRLAAKFGGSQSVKVTRRYRLDVANPIDADVVYAYVCPYVMGQTHARTVGADANLMFTAEMSGCTFGVGSATPNGSRMVCHANDAAAGLNGGALAQEAAQQAASATSLHEPGTLFEPNQYRPATATQDLRAAIIGFREGADWQFWAQVYDFNGTGLADMDIIRIA